MFTDQRKMNHYILASTNYVKDQARHPESARPMPKQARPQTKEAIDPVDFEMEVDDEAEARGFTEKLRLNIPSHSEVGIVCMPNLMSEFALKTMNPSSGDKEKKPANVADIESWVVAGVGRTKAQETREFKTRPGKVDTSCYFMIIEGADGQDTMVVPVSHYLTIDPVIIPKGQGTPAPKKTEMADALMEQRIVRMTKSEDVMPVFNRPANPETGEELPQRREKVASIPWDYEGEPSDDEELYPQEDNEDDVDPMHQPKLTSFGQKMKSLLQQQMEREVDEELQQYSDEEEGSQTPVTGKQQRTNDTQESQSTKKTKTEEDKSSKVEERVLRFLRQNNGKVPVKGVLAHFKITQKNEEFRLIQTVIQRCCTMSAEEKDGSKVKCIALKPEFQ